MRSLNDPRRRVASRSRRSGQIFIMFVATIIILMAVCVFAIDIGRLFLSRAQLQNAVDSAALAGGSELTTTNMTSADKTRVENEAKSFASLNVVDGDTLTLGSGDIVFGHYDKSTRQFVPEDQCGIIDSVQITGRRTETSPDGPIDLIFGDVFGWDEATMDNVVGVATKPRRYVMFVLDRSGSMCFDTPGVTREPEDQGPGRPTIQLSDSDSGWIWVPEETIEYDEYGNEENYRTAWFHAKDKGGQTRTDFLPEHIKNHLVDGKYFNFRSRDNSSYVQSGWIKVPDGVTIYSRYDDPWCGWWANDYFHVVSYDCGYAHSSGAVQPLQDSMDAACAFVDLMRPADDRAGLVTYASKDSLNQHLTDDLETVKKELQKYAPCGSTAEPDGMEAALDEFIDSGRADGFGQRVMVLLTDGNANRWHGTGYGSSSNTFELLGETVTTNIHPTVADAMGQQAERARQNDVRIYCVTFGDDVDTEVHRVIAQHTNAAYYYSANHSDLTDIFVDIFRRLPPIITR